jgi:hypothetical protein
LGCFLLFFYFLWHLYITYFYTIVMSGLNEALNAFTSDATRSFKDPVGTLKAFPALVVRFVANGGLLVLVLMFVFWAGTGWRLSISLVKSSFTVSGFDGGRRNCGGMPGNFGGDIGLFDGSGLQRRAAQSDIIGLGWDIRTRDDLDDYNQASDYRRDGFQDNYNPDLGTGAKSGFGTREPPIFQEVSVDTLRTEDREREAVAALAKINSERTRRRPDMEYDPLPWKPFWDDWKKEKTDVYSGFKSGLTADQRALLGPSMVNSPGFFRG